MIHLRIVAPSHQAEHALDLLKRTSSVCNLIHLERAAVRPEGDVILCDVAREDASVIVGDLKELDIDVEGSIAIEEIDSQISEAAKRAEKSAKGAVADAVVREEVESRTSENIELSASFIGFMVLSTSPDEFSFIVAYLAGMAGVLSLTSAKSGALVGVLISVTTIPAAANIGVAAALGDGAEWVGAMEQLAINLSAIFLAGIGTLYVQRLLYLRHRRRHLYDESREAAGLPMGHSRRGGAPAREPTTGRR